MILVARLDALDPEHNEIHLKLGRLSFAILDQVATTAPTIDTLPPGTAQLYDDGTNKRMYLNIANTIHSLILYAGAPTSVVTDHGGLTGLGDDDHTIYALLAGRAGGQSVVGGTAANEDLVLRSTAHATKGEVRIQDGRAKFDDAAANAGAAGELFRNGARLSFHDGTAARNILLAGVDVFPATDGYAFGFQMAEVSVAHAGTLNTYVTIDSAVFTKTSGLSTLKAATHIRDSQAAGATSVRLNVSSLNGTAGSITSATTYDFGTGGDGSVRQVSLDISTLTNGTQYTANLQMAHDTNTTQTHFAKLISYWLEP